MCTAKEAIRKSTAVQQQTLSANKKESHMGIYFNVNDFGACADGKTLNTMALQQAVDECHSSGGGIVVCEAGTYLTGSLNLKSNVELYLAPGCRILGSPDLSHYPDFVSEGFKGEKAPEKTSKYLIGAQHANNIAITGPGEINASGISFFDQTAIHASGRFANKPEERPRLLMLHKCQDVRIQDASFTESPCWTFWLMLCERVAINRIKISGDKRMLNNDGIDLDGCKDVVVSDCYINTEDDSIVIRAIQSVHEEPAICENIAVTNCTLESTCQCVRISCPSDHITRNCVFSNLTLRSRHNGINFDFPHRYVTTGSGTGADVSNISFSNLVIDCYAHPIRIEAQEGVKLTRVTGLSFDNIRAASTFPCVVKGTKDTIIEDVSFSNMQMKNNGDQAIICSQCRNVKLNNVEFTNISEATPGAPA